MILQIQHETRLEYTDAVLEWLAEVRMEPVSDERQSCHSFHLSVSQPVTLFRYQDGFGNHVHHFNLLTPHQQVRVLAASIVETTPAETDLAANSATWPLTLDNDEPELHGYVQFGGPVRDTPLLAPVLDATRPRPGERLGAVLERVSRHIHERFEYARAVTNVSSPIDDLLTQGKGVCQDFAHLMIAVLRSFGVPARYVSGYIHRPNMDSQSHAWCEAWLPDLGWVGMDPTNNCVAGDHFVRVAVGRDFTDVTPNKGVYRGKGQESVWVRVGTRALERVPSLSWQEELPPLDVPLTALHQRQRFNWWRNDGPEQEQQQQQ
ncbi:MAG: transglutaminase family protein [Gemmataceae bacterium]|nr:transglutaminase family protein [Gemmataceae bacterium]